MTPFRHCEEGDSPTKQSRTYAWRLLRAEEHRPRNDENLRLLYSHKILNLKNMRLAFAQFMGDDATGSGVDEVMIIVYDSV